MKVLLIDPPSQRFGLNTAFAHLAPIIRERGHEFFFIDMNNKRGFGNLRNQIKKINPDVIGLALLSLTYNVVMKITKDIKNYYNKPIILGGPQTFIDQEKIFTENHSIDIIIIGEAELTINNVLDKIEKNQSLENVKGIIYKEGDKITKNPPRELIHDLDALPYPDYSIYDSLQYNSFTNQLEYPLFTSRGCPYNCSFCTTPAYYNRKWRARKPEKCIDELKQAIKKNPKIKHFMIRDENFTVNRKSAKKFCELLIKEKLGLTWDCIFRADGFDIELAKLIEKAGCVKVQVGIESLDTKTFDMIDKGEKLEDVIKGIKTLKKETNMKIFGYFVLGLPGDTFKKTMKTYKLSKKLNLDYTEWQHLMVFPKTEVNNQVKSMKGRIIKDYKEQIDPYEVGFETPEFTKKEREKAYDIIRTKEKAYRFDLNKSNFENLILNLKNIIKYDFWSLPAHLYKIIIKGSQILLFGRSKVIGKIEVKD